MKARNAACVLALALLLVKCQAGTPGLKLVNFDHVAHMLATGPSAIERPRSLVQGSGRIIPEEQTTAKGTTSTQLLTSTETLTSTQTPTETSTLTSTWTSTRTSTRTSTWTSTSTTISTSTVTTTTRSSSHTSTTETATNTTTTNTHTPTRTETSTSSNTQTYTGTLTSTRTVTLTNTSTLTSTVTATSTATETHTVSTTTLTRTTTSTYTTSETETVTTTTSATTTATTTVTKTLTTTTSTSLSTTTTTPYCFETGVQWGPIDMQGTLASKEMDEFACQRKCLKTPGCSHFSFWRPGRLCHLEDRYALRREGRHGFVSGPFQCWSYLMPGKYTKQGNNTFLPSRFRCMQVGVTWSPDMAVPMYIEGERDDVVFSCQKKCQDTMGCKHFTVMFPGLCRLADQSAVPLPAEQAISGAPTQECSDPSSEAPLGHTFMKKFPLGWQLPAPSSSQPLLVPAALAASSLAAALIWLRRRPSRTVEPTLVDLEESLQWDAQE